MCMKWSESLQKEKYVSHTSLALYCELCELCVLPISGVYYLEAAM